MYNPHLLEFDFFIIYSSKYFLYTPFPMEHFNSLSSMSFVMHGMCSLQFRKNFEPTGGGGGWMGRRGGAVGDPQVPGKVYFNVGRLPRKGKVL